MRIGSFEHNPGVVKTVFFLLFFSLALALGTWQMLRAAEKNVILKAASTALAAPAVNAHDLTDLELAAKQHTQVSISGRYAGNKQFLWDNRVHKSQAGFEIITPVRTPNGLVLVNRGWVAPGLTRQDLPNVELSDEQLAKSVSITGLFSRPSKGFLNGDAFDASADWPLVLQYFDYAAMEQALGEPVLAGVIQPQQAAVADQGGASPAAEVESAEVGSAKVESVSDQSDFYVANWEPTAAIGPTRHYGYAFQWYAMAVALIVLFIVYNTRRIESVQ